MDHYVIRAWRSLRSLRGARWLIEHGIEPTLELTVLNAQLEAHEGWTTGVQHWDLTQLIQALQRPIAASIGGMQEARALRSPDGHY